MTKTKKQGSSSDEVGERVSAKLVVKTALRAGALRLGRKLGFSGDVHEGTDI